MTQTSQDKSESFLGAEKECWHLAQNCARWAAETQDRSVRDAFLAMAKALTCLGLQDTREA